MSSEKYPPRVEAIVEFLDHSQKPWFLSTTEVYKLVKNAASAVPLSQTVLEQSLTALAFITKYINESTRLNIVIDVEQSHDLITKIDSILSEQLVVLDDGLDGLRGKLSSSLRQLLVALVNHKKWAEDYAEDTKDSAVAHAKTRYERAMAFVQSLVEAARERFPATVDFVESTVANVQSAAQSYATGAQEKVNQLIESTAAEGKARIAEVRHKVDATVFGTVQYFLSIAQPYVHKAVKTGTPYVNKAIEVSQPYVQRAQPYVDNLVVKATEVTESLKENKLVGPYVDTAYSLAHTALDETKHYITPPEEAQ